LRGGTAASGEQRKTGCSGGSNPQMLDIHVIPLRSF